MHRRRSIRCQRATVGSGGVISSLINRAVDLLPIELHLPGGYQFCGPGTKLKKRLARGDPGINGLDKACKVHDIAYSKYKDSERRQQADKELAEQAWRRFKASDASLGEKAAAWAVTTAMKTKAKFGGGNRKGRGKKGSGKKAGGKKGKGLYLRPYPKQGAGKRIKRKTQRGKKKHQSR